MSVDPIPPARPLQLNELGTLGARQLGCRRGRRLLFRGLALRLDAGSITWLRGTNGSGKTSLMRILAGLSAPAEGEVTWNDRPMAGSAARQAIVYIGHANALKDDLTLAEAVAFQGTLGGAGTRAAMESFMASGGQTPAGELRLGELAAELHRPG